MSGTITEPTSEPTPAQPPAASPGDNDADKTPTLTQAQFNKAIAEERRLWDEKAKRDAERAAQKAAEDAAAEQGKYRELAETRAARIVELETQAAQIEMLTNERDQAHAVIAGLVEDELKLAPPYVAEAISERSPVAKLDYLRKHRESWTRSNGNPPGVPPTPRPNGTHPSREEQIAQEIAAQRARGRR